MSQLSHNSRQSRHPDGERKILLISLLAALTILLGGIMTMIFLREKVEPDSISLQPQQSIITASTSADSSTDSTSSTEQDSTDKDRATDDSFTSSEPDDQSAANSGEESWEEVSDSLAQSVGDEYVKTIKIEKLVPESEAVDQSYLDDAVFIGDSISVSLSLYKALPAKNVVATQNISLYQITAGKKVFATAKGKVTLKKALSMRKEVNKIYIMLGANGMSTWSNKRQIAYYKKLLNQLQKWYPDAIIYVQSMSPVTAKRDKQDKHLNNDNIDDFNERLLALVEKRDEHVYFLNSAESLKTKYGNLKAKYDGGDGLHFSPAAARQIVSYALTHTVSDDTVFYRVEDIESNKAKD